MSKTLVFSFDGTGNEPDDAGKFEEDESLSNVLKLHVLMGGGIEIDQSETKTPAGQDQLTFYYNGIGTRRGRRWPLLGRLYSIANEAMAPSFGDVKDILEEASQDFNGRYEAGDKLVIFGFSRGAALARKFASLILKDREDRTVSFLGVFDTVAAMDGIHRRREKISTDVVFENGTLNERIKKAVHLVSVDENRVAFEPTLINKDPDNPKRILEVWLPGVHSDVGGGYWLDGLSDVSLEYMIECCQKTLGDNLSIADGGNPENIRALFAKQKNALTGLDEDDIAIKALEHGMVHTHIGVMAALKGAGLCPRSIHVNDNDQPSKQPDDLPILHYSVKQRFDTVADYRPAAMRGLDFKLLHKDGSCSDQIHGISGLRAHSLPGGKKITPPGRR